MLWPAVSPNVVAVGGTSLNWSGSGTRYEAAWLKTGGGLSAYANGSLNRAVYKTNAGVPEFNVSALGAFGAPWVPTSTAAVGLR